MNENLQLASAVLLFCYPPRYGNPVASLNRCISINNRQINIKFFEKLLYASRINFLAQSFFKGKLHNTLFLGESRET